MMAMVCGFCGAHAGHKRLTCYAELERERAENARLQDGYDSLKCQYDEEHDRLLSLQTRVEEAEQEIERRKGYPILECGHRVLWPDDSPAICTDCLKGVYSERDRYKALAERCGEALEAREAARLVKEEYYRQSDLGQPPSEEWDKLSFIDVTGARLHADELARAAIDITPEEAKEKYDG